MNGSWDRTESLSAGGLGSIVANMLTSQAVKDSLRWVGPMSKASDMSLKLCDRNCAASISEPPWDLRGTPDAGPKVAVFPLNKSETMNGLGVGVGC